MIYKKNKIPYYAISIIAFLFISYAISIHLAVIIVSLVLSYRYTSKVVSKKIADSKLSIFSTSFFIYFIILQIAILLSWLFNHNFPLLENTYLAFGILLVLNFIAPRKEILTKNYFFKSSDIFSIITTIVILVPLVFLPLFHTRGGNSGQLLSLVSNGVDDASHIGLLNDRIQFNTGVLYGSDHERDTRSAGAASYPAGWHSANAVFAKSIFPGIKTGTESIVFYIMTKILWFSLLVFLSTKASFMLFKRFFLRETTLIESVILVITATALFSLTISDTFIEGFYSFIPQLIIIVLFIQSLMDIPMIDRRLSLYRILTTLSVPLLLCAATSFSWLLLLPALIISIGLIVINKPKVLPRKFWKFNRDLLQIVFILLITISSVAVQLFTTSHGSGSVSFINGLLLNGGITIYPLNLCILLLITSFLLIKFAKKTNYSLRTIFMIIGAFFLFTSVLYFIQQYFTQSNLYYYFKSLNSLLLILSILSISVLTYVYSIISKKYSRTTGIVCSLIIVMAIFQFIYPNPPIFAYAKGIHSTTQKTNEIIWDTLDTSYTQRNYDNKDIVVFYPENNASLNEIGSTLLKSNKPNTTCYTAVKNESFSTPVEDFNLNTLQNNCTDNEKITYYVDERNLTYIQNLINNSTLEIKNNIHINKISY